MFYYLPLRKASYSIHSWPDFSQHTITQYSLLARLFHHTQYSLLTRVSPWNTVFPLGQSFPIKHRLFHQTEYFLFARLFPSNLGFPPNQTSSPKEAIPQEKAKNEGIWVVWNGMVDEGPSSSVKTIWARAHISMDRNFINKINIYFCILHFKHCS